MSIFKNTFVLAIDRIFHALCNFIIFYLIAKNIGVSALGLYHTAFNIFIILNIITIFIDDKIIKAHYLTYEDTGIFFNAISSKIFLLIIAAASFNGYQTLSKAESEVVALINIFLIYGLFQSVSIPLICYFEVTLKTKSILLSSLVYIIALSLGFYVISKYFLNLNAIVSVLVISSICKLCFLVYRLPNDFIFEAPNFIAIKTILFKSQPFAWAALAAILYARIDLLMVSYFLGLYDAGLYTAALQVNGIYLLLLAPFQAICMPFMKKRHELGLQSQTFIIIYRSLITLVTFGAIFLSFIYYMSLDYLFFAFLPSEYLAALPIIYINLITGILYYNAYMRSTIMVFEDLGKQLVITQFLGLLINVVLNYFFIRQLGAIGAALATLLTVIVVIHLFSLFNERAKIVWLNQFKIMNPLKALKIINKIK